MSQADTIPKILDGEPQPRLTLAVDGPSSASPFPSPSSAFLPPPIPSSHEFANKISANKRFRGKSVGNAQKDKVPDMDSLTKDTPPIPSIATVPDSKDIDQQSTSQSTSTHSQVNGVADGDTAALVKSQPAASITGPALSPATSSQPPILSAQTQSQPTMTQPPASATLVPAANKLGVHPVTTPAPHATTTPQSGAHINPVAPVNLTKSHPDPEAVQQDLPTTSDSTLATLDPAENMTSKTKLADIDTVSKSERQPDRPTHSRNVSVVSDDGDGALTPVARRPPSSAGTAAQTASSSQGVSRSLSLSSSRPAPPSPALSRRSSANLVKRHSSLHKSGNSISALSTGSSGGLDRSNSLRSAKVKRQSTGALSALSKVVTQDPEPEPTRAPAPIIVRDFAYAPTDEYFSKVPPELLPRSERPSSITLDSDSPGPWQSSWGGFYGNRTSRALGESSGKKKKKSGWAAFGALLSRKNGTTPADSSDDDGEEYGEETPSEQASSTADRRSGTFDLEDDSMDDFEEAEPDLRPGLYRALYAFEPEGTAEMALYEDQIVRVIGRGGGVGWAIVERPAVDASAGALGLAGQALVPESYLEPYDLDDDDELDYDGY